MDEREKVLSFYDSLCLSCEGKGKEIIYRKLSESEGDRMDGGDSMGGR